MYHVVTAYDEIDNALLNFGPFASATDAAEWASTATMPCLPAMSDKVDILPDGGNPNAEPDEWQGFGFDTAGECFVCLECGIRDDMHRGCNTI